MNPIYIICRGGLCIHPHIISIGVLQHQLTTESLVFSHGFRSLILIEIFLVARRCQSLRLKQVYVKVEGCLDLAPITYEYVIEKWSR